MDRNLLIMTPGFPADESDTTCMPAIQQFLLCYQQQFPGTRIYIISLQYPFKAGIYKWNSITVRSVGGRNRNGLQRVATISKAVLTAAHQNRKQPFDYVLSFWYTDAALAAKIFAGLTGMHHIVWMQGQDALKTNKYPSWARIKGEQIAAISPFQKNVLQREQGIIAGSVVSNGINTTVFPKLNTNKRKIDLLAVGSLIELKQYDLFIQLIEDLKHEGFIKINAVLAGAGPLEATLKQQCRDAGIEAQIVFTGALPHQSILELMNNAILFIHPSRYEGCSTVVLEAAYSGCEVLAFIPPGDKQADRIAICGDYREMKNKCKELLLQPAHFTREKYYDMRKSAMEINALLEERPMPLIVQNGNKMNNEDTALRFDERNGS